MKNEMSRFEVNMFEVCCALSDALDLVGVKVVQHGKRVAYMAQELALASGAGEEQLKDLFLASVLHDCGVSSTEMHWNIISGLHWEGEGEHCAIGYELLREVEPFHEIATMVLHHHTPWARLEREALPGHVRAAANCIYLADRIDALNYKHRDKDILLARKEIVDAIAGLGEGYFAPQYLDALRVIAQRESFWLMLEPHHLERYFADVIRHTRSENISYDQLKSIANIFARVVDSKSPFTAEHSKGVSKLARFLGQKSGLSAYDCDMIEIAGLLHDLGKLRVPDRILEKPGSLDEQEFAVIERHTFETYQILSRISLFRQVAEWAAFHHEALAGWGYPFRRHDQELPLQARIVAVADIFQALAQHRPYRGSLKPDEIAEIMGGMVTKGKLDARVVSLANQHLAECYQVATNPG